MQLDMAKQQREMQISMQAAQMTADATQHQLQIDMQNKMVLASVSQSDVKSFVDSQRFTVSSPA